MEWADAIIITSIIAPSALIAGPILQLVGLNLAVPIKDRSDIRPAITAGVTGSLASTAAIAVGLHYLAPPWILIVWLLALPCMASVGATIPSLIQKSIQKRKPKLAGWALYGYSQELFEKSIPPDRLSLVRESRKPINVPSAMLNFFSELSETKDGASRMKAMENYRVKFDIGCAQAAFAAIVLRSFHYNSRYFEQDEWGAEQARFTKWVNAILKNTIQYKEDKNSYLSDEIFGRTLDAIKTSIGSLASGGEFPLDALFVEFERQMALCPQGASTKEIRKKLDPMFRDILSQVAGPNDLEVRRI
ncbi:MAG: hypothetical protein KDA53_13045 [Hyphomonas sp.]|nr:hypothetical protein [Hyphomonas sp.]